MRKLMTGDKVQLNVNTTRSNEIFPKPTWTLCDGEIVGTCNGLLVVKLLGEEKGEVTCYRQDLAFVPPVDYCAPEQRKATSLLLIERQNGGESK